jgi:TolB-like protein
MCKKVVICLLIATAALAAPKLNIAFIGIEPSGVSESVALGVSISFRDALVNTHRFEVVERERLAALVEEQGLTLSGCTTTECFVQVGQLAGAQKVIGGEVTQVGGSYIISVRMVDVYSGRVEQSLSEVSRSLEDLLTAANSLAVKLSESISIEGTVVSFSGNTVKIDIGSQEGVNLNDTVYLVRWGKEYYHPETGMFLGRDVRELGTATITCVLADELSEAVLEGTYSVVVGDKVRLTEPVGIWPVISTSTVGRIAFMSNRDGDYEIYVMDADGRNQTQLTFNDDWDHSFAWSPDGRRIAFFKSDTIYVMEADGLNETQLTYYPSFDVDLDWSPDGRSIVFESSRGMGWEIFVMDSDGSNQTQLTNNIRSDMSGCDPIWNPDGRRIAFNSDRDGDDEIFVMDADGSHQTQLTFNASDDRVSAWSPDGRRIAFHSDRDGDWEIFVMDADGRNQTQLTNNSSDDFFRTWSPDGRRIAFQSDRDGDWEIFVMDADGCNQTQLTNNSSDDSFPAWSPDGRRIAFGSDRDGDWEIFVMDADGCNQTQLTTSGGLVPAWCPME